MAAVRLPAGRWQRRLQLHSFRCPRTSPDLAEEWKTADTQWECEAHKWKYVRSWIVRMRRVNSSSNSNIPNQQSAHHFSALSPTTGHSPSPTSPQRMRPSTSASQRTVPAPTRPAPASPSVRGLMSQRPPQGFSSQPSALAACSSPGNNRQKIPASRSSDTFCTSDDLGVSLNVRFNPLTPKDDGILYIVVRKHSSRHSTSAPAGQVWVQVLPHSTMHYGIH